MDITESPRRHQHDQLGLVPQHCGPFRDPVYLGIQLEERRLRLERPTDSPGREWPQRDLLASPRSARQWGSGSSAVPSGSDDQRGHDRVSETVPPGTGTLTAISCVSTSDCQAVSDFDASTGSPSIIVTTDGGTTWLPENFPATVANFTSVSCVDTLHRTAVGSSSAGPAAVAITTTNGGGTWSSAARSGRCHQPQRHLVLERHRVCGRGFTGHPHDRRRCAMAGQGKPHRRHRPLLGQLLQCDRLHRRRRREHLGHGRRSIELDEPSRSAGIGSLVGVSCAGPANCEAVGSGTNFGGTIQTLSAPPTVTTSSPNIGTIRVRYVSSLNASGGLGRTRGPSRGARSPLGSDSHQTEL